MAFDSHLAERIEHVLIQKKSGLLSKKDDERFVFYGQ